MTDLDPFDGLKPGRIVYYVFSESTASEVNRRRTTRSSIAERIKSAAWPVGAQAHIGNPVAAGDRYPAMVIRHHGSGSINLKVFLDGSDDYWATAVPYNDGKMIGTWGWMFEGQAQRYQPDRVEKVSP